VYEQPEELSLEMHLKMIAGLQVMNLPAAPLFELLERVCTLYSLPNWHDCVSISMLLASFGASYAKQCGNYLFLLIFGTLSSILHT
jgi:hypothetical protein